IANSRFYADAMAEYLGLARDKIRIVPLGIETRDFTNSRDLFPRSQSRTPASRAPTIGYLARLAPDKGLHILADAFVLLRKMPGMDRARLRIAGWLGESGRAYAEMIFDKLRAAGVADNTE